MAKRLSSHLYTRRLELYEPERWDLSDEAYSYYVTHISYRAGTLYYDRETGSYFLRFVHDHGVSFWRFDDLDDLSDTLEDWAEDE